MEIKRKILIHVKTKEENQAIIDILQKFNIEMIWRNWNNWELPYGKTYEISENSNRKFLVQLRKVIRAYI